MNYFCFIYSVKFLFHLLITINCSLSALPITRLRVHPFNGDIIISKLYLYPIGFTSSCGERKERNNT